MTFDEVVQVPEAQSAVATSAQDRRRRQAVTVGGLPRVSLLPPAVRDAARVKVIRRVLIGGVAAAVALTGAGILLATGASAASADRLAAATGRTQTLAAQIAKFSDVSKLTQEIALGRAAKTVGSSTQIDWRAQYDDLVADMPYGYTVKSITADSASVFGPYDQGSSPLDLPRVATVVMTVTAPSTTDLPPWLRKIRSIPAYADETHSWTSSDASGGGAGVTITITVHLDRAALVNQKASKS